MNYYRHHLGDYAKDTGHLSLAEHGAYRLLMDHYYATEKRIPDDIVCLWRICGATTRTERAAVRSVVSQFFTALGGSLGHKRIDCEIVDCDAMRQKNAENGKRGGRPKETQTKPSGLIVGSEMETQTADTYARDHKPIANSHVLLEKEPKARQRAKPALAMPQDASPERLAILADWLAYKTEKHQKYEPLGWKALMTKITTVPDADLIAAIRFAMSANYSGFSVDWQNGRDNSNARSHQPARTPATNTI